MEEALTFILDILGWPLEFLGQFPLIRNILAVIFGSRFYMGFRCVVLCHYRSQGKGGQFLGMASVREE